MLPAPQRLSKDKEIQVVVKQGRRARGRFVLIYTQKAIGTGSRIACVVGKKVSPSSVIRHKYQRWLREAIRLHLSEIRQPSDMVIVGLPSLRNTLQYQDVASDVAATLKKIYAHIN